MQALTPDEMVQELSLVKDDLTRKVATLYAKGQRTAAEQAERQAAAVGIALSSYRKLSYATQRSD